MPKRPRSYEGKGIVVRFELGRCIHAAECVKGLPDVFDPRRRPWIDPGKAEPDDIAKVVSRCPTGALTFERLDGGPGEDTPAGNRLSPVPDGPLYASGCFSVALPDGEVLEATRVALCRCGASENKPFCDNRHRVVAFRDDGRLGRNRLAPVPGDAESSEPAEAVRIEALPDGPLLVEGPVEVRSAVGREPEDAQVGRKGALCRCGASKNRPYCDGSHVEAGFRAP